jgi:hypothetical protein
VKRINRRASTSLIRRTPNTSQATIDDLLDSLDYGKRSAENDILDALCRRFDVSARTHLRSALQSVPPALVLEEILHQIQPFALMIEEIYAFLSDVSVRIGGKLEVHVTREQARALKLDPENYQQYERQVVETVRQIVIDPARLPPEGAWRQLHDFYWPPKCTALDNGSTTVPCLGCEPTERRAAFEELTCYSSSDNDSARPLKRNLRFPQDTAL